MIPHLFLYSIVAVALVNFTISIFVLLRNTRSIINLAFFTFVVGASFWISGIALIFLTQAFIFNQLILYGTSGMFGGLLLLAKVFPEGKMPPRSFFFAFIPLLGMIIGTPLGLFVRDLTVSPEGNVQAVNGPLMPFLSLILLGYILGSIFLFAKNYGRAKGLARLQMQYLFWGSLIFIIAVMLFDAALPAVGIFQFNLLGPVFSVVFVAFSGYAISKRRLLETRLVVSRAFSFLVLLALFAVTYVAFLLWLAKEVWEIQFTQEVHILVVFLVATSALTFQFIQSKVSKITDQIFLKHQYDSEELLLKLSKAMSESLDLRSMLKNALEILTNEMGATKGAFLVLDDAKIVEMVTVNYRDHEYIRSKLDSLVLRGGKAIYLFDEMPEGKEKEVFRTLHISLALPIRMKEGKDSILILGTKSSGETYYEQDVNILMIFAEGAGVAIQNARSYQAIKEFSAQLEKRVEERTRELRKSQKRELAEAENVIRLKDEFLFLATHELRTPITAIRGFLELVHEGEPQFPKDLQESLSAISDASTHLSRLIDDLLEIVHSESGKLEFPLEQIDLIPIIQEVEKEMTPLAMGKDIFLQNISLPDSLRAMGNKEKIKEVIDNLFSNAIKYNRQGGSVVLSAFSKGGEVFVEIRDTGYGIPAKQRANIFQKFYRASVRGTEGVAGTGLGLFITRMLMEKMNGRVMFSSVEGKGSTFSFSLPAV